jgi:thiosulfate/3-mercaptopyruvate sulfurtransferase
VTGAPPGSRPLVGADALADLLATSGPRPTILDVRWDLATGPDRAAYDAGHIPGAVFIDLDEKLADPPSSRGRHPLPSPEPFTFAMRAAGVSTGRPVVVYAAGTSMPAARAWWLLRYFGHPQVAVLDGGLAAWEAGGHPVESETSVPDGGDFVAQPGGMPVIAAEQVADFVAAGGVLIDARAEERFRGLAEPIDPVAGHIPGARNRPAGENVDTAGRFLEPPILRAAFERLGVAPDALLAAYCGSGITATHELLALELAGYHGALYPGSWSEWITDPARPISRDPAA